MTKKKHNKNIKIYPIILIISFLPLLSQLLTLNFYPERSRRTQFLASPKLGEDGSFLNSNKPLPCANSISCAKDLSGKYNPARTTGEYMGQSVPIPPDMFDPKIASPSVLGKSTPVIEKKIYVNLSTQRLYAYEGTRLKYEFTISSGKWNPTPVGKFYIWTKLLATPMEGGDKENNTYYNLPNVPYTMYFYNENVGKWNGYGIHGAYWPIKFGQPDSFGCISLRVKDAAKLYYWTDAEPANPPTPVIIFGKAPPA